MSWLSLLGTLYVSYFICICSLRKYLLDKDTCFIIFILLSFMLYGFSEQFFLLLPIYRNYINFCMCFSTSCLSRYWSLRYLAIYYYFLREWWRRKSYYVKIMIILPLPNFPNFQTLVNNRNARAILVLACAKHHWNNTDYGASILNSHPLWGFKMIPMFGSHWSPFNLQVKHFLFSAFPFTFLYL